MCPRFDEALERFLLPLGHTTVGEVVECIAGFPRTRDSLLIPDFGDPLAARLYALGARLQKYTGDCLTTANNHHKIAT